MKYPTNVDDKLKQIEFSIGFFWLNINMFFISRSLVNNPLISDN